MELASRPTAASWPRYQHWNDAIASHFFRAENDGRPVYLQVDDEALVEIGRSLEVSPEQSEASFLVAVRNFIDPEGRDPFRRVAQYVNQWRRQGRRKDLPPPFIALLSACVLAAGQMARDDQLGVAATNYYVRLNRLLGLEGRGRPLDFDEVTAYWDELATWLDEVNQGQKGISTSRPLGHLVHVGRPVSQCLLREAERRRLPAFFRAARIDPQPDLSGADLLPALERWCRRPSCPWPSRTKQLVINGPADVRQQLGEIVAYELAHWSGEIEEEPGRRAARILIRVKPSRGGRIVEIRLFAAHPSGFPFGGFSDGSQTFDLDCESITGWYTALPAASLDVGRVLTQGIELRRGPYSLRYAPDPVIVLAADTIGLGFYTSAPRIELGERCKLIVQESILSLVTSHLAAHAEPGWQVRAPVGLPGGWVMIDDVIVTSGFGLEVDEVLEPLLPSFPISISLRGGLKFSSSLWLEGAEPFLYVGNGTGAPVQVAIDGAVIGMFDEPIVSIDLRSQELSKGQHQVRVGTRSRVFVTTTSGTEAAATHAGSISVLLGHPLVRHGSSYTLVSPSPVPLAGDVPQLTRPWIVGAGVIAFPSDLPENLAEPLLVQGGARKYYALGPHPGMACEFRDPGFNTYTVCRDRSRLQRWFEFSPPFPVVWLVRVSCSGSWSIKRVGPPLLPTSDVWPTGNEALWRRLVIKRGYARRPKGADTAAWDAYARAGMPGP